MRYFYSSVAIACSLLALPANAIAAAPAWEPATATSVSAGASPSTFAINASVTLPQRCYAARIRSTPISLHSPRAFYIEERAPSSTCSSKNAYTCTVVSPGFPLPIPHEIDVFSKGPQRWKVMVHPHEASPTPPICGKG